MTRIILASGSPRRRELLRALGLSFEVAPADVDETPLPGEAPPDMVARLSRDKAAAMADPNPDALVIAADTVVVLAGEMLAKPHTHDENRAFLKRLAGQEHSVYTGHALAYRRRSDVQVCETRVRFRDLDDDEIDRYVATGEGLDKAGGYAIQGRGAALVPWVEGCYFNVVGLSVATVVASARRLGVTLV